MVRQDCWPTLAEILGGEIAADFTRAFRRRINVWDDVIGGSQGQCVCGDSECKRKQQSAGGEKQTFHAQQTSTDLTEPQTKRPDSGRPGLQLTSLSTQGRR